MCRVDLTNGHILPDSDCILEKVRQDEATANDPAILNEVARQKSDEVWSKAPVTANDVIERAHYAAFYNGVSIDADDNIVLPDLASDDRGKILPPASILAYAPLQPVQTLANARRILT